MLSGTLLVCYWSRSLPSEDVTVLQDNSRATYRGFMLTGLIGGLGLGGLNAVLYLFFLLPMVAHHLFHTYLHYDADVLEYAAGYVGILGILGMAAGLLGPRAIMRNLSHGQIASELMPPCPESANYEPPSPN
jgi:hypothetical protein